MPDDRSQTLREKIIEKIRSEGPINFEKFMEMALYYPGLGYYTNDSTMIGSAGDFYTSPHMHFVFGAMLGRQMEEMWNVLGNPDSFSVVEIGAGMGYIAKDMLEYLKQKSGIRGHESGDKDLFSHIRYIIVELNPALKAKQQELLFDFMDKVEWISSIDELELIKGCFLSNELLDAFPVRMVEVDDGLKEIYISTEGNEFVEMKMPADNEVKRYFEYLHIKLPEGYRTEVNLRIGEWLNEINNKLFEGFILTIDYGYSSRDYYSEDRVKGTLLCYYQHRINEDPYQNVGEQDITAHVNFSYLKKCGDELGLKTIGFCSQGVYLVSLGIDEVISEIYGDTPDPFEIAKIKKLIFPQGMGESHMVMIQYKGKREVGLRGFMFRNQVDRL